MCSAMLTKFTNNTVCDDIENIKPRQNIEQSDSSTYFLTAIHLTRACNNICGQTSKREHGDGWVKTLMLPEYFLHFLFVEAILDASTTPIDLSGRNF